MKNTHNTIGNRTLDLPACSAVPEPTVPPRTPTITTRGTNNAVELDMWVCPRSWGFRSLHSLLWLIQCLTKTFTQHVTCRACVRACVRAGRPDRLHSTAAGQTLAVRTDILLIVWLDGTPPTLFTFPLSEPLQNAEKGRSDKDTAMI